MSAERQLRATQVVPCLPLGSEAVGSYALQLGRRLAEPPGDGRPITVSYLAAAATDGEEPPAATTDPCRALRHRAAEALVEALERDRTDTALLHYSAYGFHPRGCPEWLVRGIRQWRTAAPERRLVLLFHEVYATGPPWRSSFWLAPRQKRLARALAEGSDHAVTTTKLYADLVRGLFGRRGVPVQPLVLPVFSAIGEPEEEAVRPLAARRRRLVVFGGAGPRARAWRERRRDLEAACRALRVDEVLDLGSGDGRAGPPTELAGRPVCVLGRVPAPEVRSILLDSMAGFLAYPPELLGKSTVFAAYCSHGLVPICSPWGGRRGRSEAATTGTLWWRPTTGHVPDERTLQTIADRTHAWYRQHRLEAQSAIFRRLLVEGAEER